MTFPFEIAEVVNGYKNTLPVALHALSPRDSYARQWAFGIDIRLKDGQVLVDAPGHVPPAVADYIRGHRPGIIAALEAEADEIRVELRSVLDAGKCDSLSAETREALAAIADGEGRIPRIKCGACSSTSVGRRMLCVRRKRFAPKFAPCFAFSVLLSLLYHDKIRTKVIRYNPFTITLLVVQSVAWRAFQRECEAAYTWFGTKRSVVQIHSARHKRRRRLLAPSSRSRAEWI